MILIVDKVVVCGAVSTDYILESFFFTSQAGLVAVFNNLVATVAIHFLLLFDAV